MAARRINTETGVIEEEGGFFQGYSWSPAENERGNEERINPETGVHEEQGGFFEGYSWKAKD